MFVFHWQGTVKLTSKQNKHVYRQTLATSLHELKLFSTQNKITITKIVKKSWFWHTKTLSTQSLLSIIEQLNTLLSAGFALLDSFRLIRCPKQTLLSDYFIAKLQSQILHGKTFTQSLLHTHLLDEISLNIIDAGEQSGKLERALEQVSSIMKKRLTLQQRLRKILIYPIIVAASSLGLVALMCVFVIPQFSAIYQQINTPLPWITRFFINLSTLFRQHMLLIVLLPLSCFLCIKWLLHKHHSAHKCITRIELSLPLIGPFKRMTIIYRLCLTLESTLSAGIPIINALALSFKACANASFQEKIQPIITDLTKGCTLHEAMTKTKCFNDYELQLINLGESTGKLTDMLNHLALAYEHKIDAFVNHLQTLLEPIIMVFLGTIVGSIIIAMYLPIIQLSGYF